MGRGLKRLAVLGIAGHAYSRRRVGAFVQAAESAGLTVISAFEDEPGSLPGPYDRGWATAEAHRAWLESLPERTGLYAVTDAIAQNLAQLAHLAGLAIPDHLAILGNDNHILTCETTPPGLSSIDVPFHRIGYEAACLLDALIDDPAAVPPDHRRAIAPTRVVARRSTDVAVAADDDVAAALRYMRDHLADPIQVADVVGATTICRSLLERRFKKVIGRTLHTHLTGLRLARARGLLAETHDPIAAIATQCGFASQIRFSTVFRQHEQCTPTEFRRTHGRM